MQRTQAGRIKKRRFSFVPVRIYSHIKWPGEALRRTFECANKFAPTGSKNLLLNSPPQLFGQTLQRWRDIALGKVNMNYGELAGVGDG